MTVVQPGAGLVGDAADRLGCTGSVEGKCGVLAVSGFSSTCAPDGEASDVDSEDSALPVLVETSSAEASVATSPAATSSGSASGEAPLAACLAESSNHAAAILSSERVEVLECMRRQLQEIRRLQLLGFHVAPPDVEGQLAMMGL